MMVMKHYAALISVSTLCFWASACGAQSGTDVVARVGRVAITSASVEHWARVISGQSEAPDPPKYRKCMKRLAEQDGKSQRGAPVIASRLKATCEHRSVALREQALGYLIGAQWLIDEATSRGLNPGSHAVRDRYQRTNAARFPGGENEFKEFLAVSGRTPADLLLEIRLAMASERLRDLATAHIPAITRAQIRSYYRGHRRHFTIPEQRIFVIVITHSMGLALKVKHEVEAGASITEFGEKQVGVSNRLDTPGHLAGNGIEKLVFSGRPHRLLGPLFFRHVDFDLIEVMRVTPAILRPLSKVRPAIEKQIHNDERRRRLAAFVKAWRLRWRAQTQCTVPYVMPKCARYPVAQALARENPYAFD
jgi:hypothetical protein